MKSSTPDKIVAEKKTKTKNCKANWMVNNSAKLDCKTKQHTQFGVSARVMVPEIWPGQNRGKKKKNKKK